MNIITYYSILQSIISPQDMVKACKDAGYNQLLLCDHNSMSAIVEFYKQCKKSEVKPILGVCLKVCELDSKDKGEYNKMYDLYLVAKNLVGYKNLLKILSIANDSDRVIETEYQKIARVNLDDIKHLTEGVCCLQGARGTELFENATYEEYILSKYKTYFKEVYKQVETDPNATDGIAWTDVRYLKPELKQDFLIILCLLLKCTLNELELQINQNIPTLNTYIKDDHSLQKKEIRDERFSKEVMKATQEFFDSCEEYNILSKPRVPRFDCPDGQSQQEYLTELCRLGWRRRFPKWSSEEKKQKYAARVKYELEVLQGCQLDGYFLVVQDYIMWAKRQGWLVGPGRGSSAGCLCSYLLGITEIDPIPFNLLFERFYSADRNSGESVSLPDIDTDFPKNQREKVVKYLEDKYGLERVMHIITFSTLKGSGALEAVLKAHEVFPFNKIKSLTKFIPLKDKISDRMQEQHEDSIIRFTLKNYPDILKSLGEYKDGVITGPYSRYLEQAIRIEGCVKGYGIHASGIFISNDDIEEVAPLMIEASGNRKICAVDMYSSDDLGLVKVDILGLISCDILMEVNNLLLGTSEDQ